MSSRSRNPGLVLLALAAIGGVGLGVAGITARAAFVPYVAAPLPQNASGDFDGDGRIDVASIHSRAGEPGISVQLSGSDAAIRLDASVAVLIDGDIDNDGDLDLVAATSTGDIVIWLNDGHGRFTRQEPSPSRGIAAESTSIDAGARSPAAACCAAPFAVRSDRTASSSVVTRIRPPTASASFDRGRFAAPALRAPPAAI